MGHRVPVLPCGRPPGRSLATRLDLLRLDPVPVRWAAAVLWVCGVVGPLLPAAAGGRGSVLPGSPSVPPGTPVGLHAVCFAPYLRLPSGCVRWVAVAAVVVVSGRALLSFSSLGGCRTRRCWNRCWRYALRGSAFSSRFLHPVRYSCSPMTVLCCLAGVLWGLVTLLFRWLWMPASLDTCPLCRALPPPSTCPALCPCGSGTLWPLLSAGVHSL